MTLLDATTTLIDAVKTYAPEDDRNISRAVKRMEKRLFILQVRNAKAWKRNRIKAFWNAMALFNGGACLKSHRACFGCPNCKRKLFFGDFCKNADFSAGGRFISMICPGCNCYLEHSK